MWMRGNTSQGDVNIKSVGQVQLSLQIYICTPSFKKTFKKVPYVNYNLETGKIVDNAKGHYM